MPSNPLIFCHHLLLLPFIFPSTRVFSNESVLCIRWPKYWSFSFSLSPSSEYSGLISFRIDWCGLAVHRTLKSLLQHHSLKASILCHSTLFLVQLSMTPRTAARQASLSITNSCSLFKLMSIQSVMPSSHLILCRPLLPPSIFPSIRVCSSESVLCIRWPKYWSFSFSLSPSSEYSGLISFKIDWLDLLAVQGTLKSLLQHHNSKGSILQCSALFIVQLLQPYMTTGKTITLTRWNLSAK